MVLTPAWLESKWCSNELAIAREKGKAVFVARVKPCPGGPLIPAIQEVDLTSDWESGLAKLARGLKKHGLDPRGAFDWDPGRPIYPGLAVFDVEDAAIFFGRNQECQAAIEALRRLRFQSAGAPKLLLVTGASGSGKSSLLRAGILPWLRRGPHAWSIMPLFHHRAAEKGLRNRVYQTNNVCSGRYGNTSRHCPYTQSAAASVSSLPNRESHAANVLQETDSEYSSPAVLFGMVAQ